MRSVIKNDFDVMAKSTSRPEVNLDTKSHESQTERTPSFPVRVQERWNYRLAAASRSWGCKGRKT